MACTGQTAAPEAAADHLRKVDEELAALFVASARLVARDLSRAGPSGLSNARYELLRALGGMPQRMGRVAERLAVTPRAVTELADALESEGLVQRRVDPRDRRSHLLEITPSGTDLLNRVGRERVARAGRLLGGLVPWERAALGGLLAKVVGEEAEQ